jgi:PAS domain S-box-containing protein
MAELTRPTAPPGAPPLGNGHAPGYDERLAALFTTSQPARAWERWFDVLIGAPGPQTTLAKAVTTMLATAVSLGLVLTTTGAGVGFIPVTSVIVVVLVYGYCGILPGVVATAATALGGVYFDDPAFEWKLGSGEDRVRLVSYIVMATLTGLVFNSARRLLARSERVVRSRDYLLEEVSERERRWVTFAESIPAMVLVTAADGTLEFANRLTHEYTGLTTEQLARTNDGGASYVAADDLRRMQRLWAKTIARGEPAATEARFRASDGEFRLHSIRATPIRDDAGRLQRWLTICMDVHDRARAEDALALALAETESARALVDAVVMNSPEAVSVLDREGRFIRVNSAAAEINGLPIEAHIGRMVEDLLPDVKSQRELFARVLAGETVRDIEVSGGTPSSPEQDRWWLCSYYPIWAAGEVDGICVLFREITAWKRAQAEREALVAELQRANAAKDEFLGLMSHELRTPITTVVGNAQVLRAKSDAISSEDRAAALDDIATEGQRLHTIIENMLVLSRLERGHRIDLEPVIMRRLVDTAVAQHRKTFPRRDVNVDGKTRDLALGEPAYIAQIIGNLLTNADKYSPPSRPIDVVTEQRDGYVEVHVLDRGDGFGEDEAEQLFDPFYRSPRNSADVKGVGVGLAVCKRLVEVQHGYMWARGRDGGGSDIGFAIPVATDE